MDSISCFINLFSEVQELVFNTSKGVKLTHLEVSVPAEKKLPDFAGSFNTSMKPCTLIGARTFFTIASPFVQPQGIFLAISESWKIFFDDLFVHSVLL
jgi:hypothetical protein